MKCYRDFPGGERVLSSTVAVDKEGFLVGTAPRIHSATVHGCAHAIAGFSFLFYARKSGIGELRNESHAR